MLQDYLKFALSGIMHRSLRSYLTTIGIFVGIMAVVALISLGQGLQNVIDYQFKKIGSNRVLISPGGGGVEQMAMSGYTAAKLDDSDLRIVRNVRGVEYAVGIVMATGKINIKGKTKFAPVLALPTDARTTDFLKEFDYFIVEQGRYLKEDDKFSAIVAPNLGIDLFDREIEIGDKIFIEDREFSVVGIQKKTGNPFHDMKIVIPLETGEEIFNKTDYSLISARVKKGYEPADVADDIKKKLRRHRHVKENEEDFSVETAENVVGVLKNVLGVVQIVLVGIAAISLIVGGIGIMTTMYTSILERTRQIGIMKAIGARNSDILTIFLIESGLLGLAGGIIGTLLGLAISKSVELIAAEYGLEIFRAYISIELIIGALGFSFIVGCISGFLPARRASKMNPVDALRY
ncbi:MAG: ABC transporter permease [Candidatus Altiarchaeales archaeon]|nr:MAG: ABC transporter permease [Candidatus Altiarchaeales archaeon]RLI95546.1 MAG: ABC transporter permease [Candidatus Altiarchaeales archaeon]RLI95585.1 MAG: ABC transporter permease [Candidatus Altiarchaeales archaeon]HDO82550.1 ABC transporter permease [Candidatus Altiarchaeales archaeon]HEX55199.1 ABC transporter permease [Candidatus Altiarchaeales archaeon]